MLIHRVIERRRRRTKHDRLSSLSHRSVARKRTIRSLEKKSACCSITTERIKPNVLANRIRCIIHASLCVPSAKGYLRRDSTTTITLFFYLSLVHLLLLFTYVCVCVVDLLREFFVQHTLCFSRHTHTQAHSLCFKYSKCRWSGLHGTLAKLFMLPCYLFIFNLYIFLPMQFSRQKKKTRVTAFLYISSALYVDLFISTTILFPILKPS